MASPRPPRLRLWLGLVPLVLACATTPSVPSPAPAVHATRPPCSAVRECLSECASGDTRACTLAADRLRYGSGTARDVPRAERLYQRACEANDGLACAGLGWNSQGPEAERVFTRARPLLEAACALEDAEACVSAGLLRLEGKGGPVEVPEGEARVRRGLELLTAACQSGEGAACVRAASLFEAGPEPVRDESRALVYLQRACEAGVPGGCTSLGLRYLTGRGVARDRARALAFFKKGGELFRASCDAGEVAACVELGQAFELGQGVPVNPERALAYQQRACVLGDAASCLHAAGRLRQDSEGTPYGAAQAATLEVRAKVLLEEGCGLGSGADCLALAERVPAERASELRRRACALGHEGACGESR